MWQGASNLNTCAAETFVGREDERNVLRSVLTPDGPGVIHVYGIAGIGKTALLEIFAGDARDATATVIRLDCRTIEPTVPGFFQALGAVAGATGGNLEAVLSRLGGLASPVVLALDNFDLFRLLDTWLRQTFVPALPDSVRMLFFSRQRPVSAWFQAPGWGRQAHSLHLQALSPRDATALLMGNGVARDASPPLVRAAHGHPLALQLAAAASREHPSPVWPRASLLQNAVDELSQMFLAEVDDPVTRRLLEGAVVVRRVTVSLLQALFPDIAPQDAYERLGQLQFVDHASDGLVIHDAVRDPLARSLHASDPCRYLDYRRSAWRQLVNEAEAAARDDLWRYTADMLYLIENPVVREAFFPTGTAGHTVEIAQPEDSTALADITRTHEGKLAGDVLLHWWRRLPQAFSVVRSQQGTVEGFYCKLRANQVEPGWLQDDPVTAQWTDHLLQHPIGQGETALFCRRWLSHDEGDAPSDVQAAVWLDLKRSYMELRPGLRRVYLTARNLSAYGQVAQRLGFEALSGQEVALDGNSYPSAVLDFGPNSVDGWLAELAAVELGVRRTPASLPVLLNMGSRQLVLPDGPVNLTPLEFGVMRHLVQRQGKAVSRTELLNDVWGTRYEGGSNVVDAVVRSLRRKLREDAARVETVTGVGYRLRLTG